ncbi:MAG TPA: hypothetical protein VH247_08100 [Thermoleophilaceae bacterium]|nr:hypothetical protein [Thermoleophilaceae bacterium]
MSLSVVKRRLACGALLAAVSLGISAFGYNPGDSKPQSLYPWVGFRLGVVGNVK